MSFLPLICLAVIHGVVDAFSQVVSPLWPRMETDFGLKAGGITLLFAAWQVAASVSQPIFGYWGDRFGSRWLIWLGPAVAIVSISLIGVATGPISLACLLILGGFGIGAFHPEAISHVAERAGPKSTNALAIFIAGGMIGLGIGPILSGMLVENYGLRSIVWAWIPGLFMLGLALLILRPRGGPTHHPEQENGFSLAEIFRGRVLPSGLLLLVGTFRTVPAIGIPLVLAFLFHQRGMGETDIGQMQSIFLLSGGLGTLACPFMVKPGREIRGIFWTTLLPTGCLLLVNLTHPAAYYIGLIVSGFLLQGAMPGMVSYSQRLLPRGRRLAASLVMGSSWGLGGLTVAGMQAYFLAHGDIAGMLTAMIPFTLLAALGTCFLPRVPCTRTEATEEMTTMSTVEPSGAIVHST